DSLDGSVRDGPGDALAGAALEGATGGGRFGLGRGVPGWGRGLVLGDPREPWARRERSLRRRSAGDVAWYRTARHPVRLGAWAGGWPESGPIAWRRSERCGGSLPPFPARARCSRSSTPWPTVLPWSPGSRSSTARAATRRSAPALRPR